MLKLLFILTLFFMTITISSVFADDSGYECDYSECGTDCIIWHGPVCIP